MKTTLELPDDLVMEMKMRAVRERRKLKDVAAEVFRRGLMSTEESPESAVSKPKRRKIRLPLIPTSPDAPRINVTPQQLHDLEMEAEYERLKKSFP